MRPSPRSKRCQWSKRCVTIVAITPMFNWMRATPTYLNKNLFLIFVWTISCAAWNWRKKRRRWQKHWSIYKTIFAFIFTRRVNNGRQLITRTKNLNYSILSDLPFSVKFHFLRISVNRMSHMNHGILTLKNNFIIVCHYEYLRLISTLQ